MVHMCSLISLIGSLPEDIRSHEIRIRPVLFWITIGVVFQLVTGEFFVMDFMAGMLPAAGCFAISKMCKDCIGSGDILLICCIGILNGAVFCLKFLSVSFVSIFFYCTVMLMRGKIKCSTQVACVPFLIVGYIGAWFI